MADFPRVFALWLDCECNASGGFFIPRLWETQEGAEHHAAPNSAKCVELVPLPEIERIIRETCAAWRERDSAMSVDIENELLDALKDV